MLSLPLSSLPDPHPTLRKFGFPDNCLHLGEHWAVLVRPAQPTLGSLVLCSTADIRAYGDLPVEAFAEQKQLVELIERSLARFCEFEKINYLMLMMVDPQVHFHVVPRYSGSRSHGDLEFADSGWPGLPDLGSSQPASAGLVARLKMVWNENL